MRIDWLNKESGGQVIVFFNGWGMDVRSVAHLKTKKDLVVCSDYRSLECEKFPDLSSYEKVFLVAWSMGVWAAANVCAGRDIVFSRTVAFNGTERPIDDYYGIPPKVYELTEKGMNERGREKFFSRMLTGEEEKKRFAENKPSRILQEQLEELRFIRKASSELKNCIRWNSAYISEKDAIVSPEHQKNWWEGKSEIRNIPGGHYPFFHFSNWEEFVEK